MTVEAGSYYSDRELRLLAMTHAFSDTGPIFTQLTSGEVEVEQITPPEESVDEPDPNQLYDWAEQDV